MVFLEEAFMAEIPFCKYPGCRFVAAPGSVYCWDHAQKSLYDYIE
jgi:hypothetical protein